jgi:hypothetical protein
LALLLQFVPSNVAVSEKKLGKKKTDNGKDGSSLYFITTNLKIE